MFCLSPRPHPLIKVSVGPLLPDASGVPLRSPQLESVQVHLHSEHKTPITQDDTAALLAATYGKIRQRVQYQFCCFADV